MGTRILVAVLWLAPESVWASGPTVVDTSPADGALWVPREALITLQFSEPMQAEETAAALQLEAGVQALPNCAGRWQWNVARTSVTCLPSPALERGAQLRVTVGPGAKSQTGEALAAEASFRFTVIASVEPSSALTPKEPAGRLPNSFGEPKDVVRRPAFLCALGASGVGDPFSWITRSRVVRLTPSSQVIHTGLLSCSVITGGLMLASGLSFGQGVDATERLRRGVEPTEGAELTALGDGAMFRGWLFGGLALAAGTSTVVLWLLGSPTTSITVFFEGNGLQAGIGGTFP